MHIFVLNGHLRFQTVIVRTKLSVSDVSVAVLLIAVLDGMRELALIS
jgi:hypothetical protein